MPAFGAVDTTRELFAETGARFLRRLFIDGTHVAEDIFGCDIVRGFFLCIDRADGRFIAAAGNVTSKGITAVTDVRLVSKYRPLCERDVTTLLPI